MKKDELNKLVILGYSQKQISEILGIGKTTVRYWLKKYGLKTEYNVKNSGLKTRLCKNCGCGTTNPKFCSQSCATSWNNVHRSRKDASESSYTCSVCGVSVRKRRKYCDGCRANAVGYGIDPLLSEVIYKKHHKSSAYALVRTRARASVQHEDKVCEHCGYEKHIEVCHIKAISEFDEDTPLSIINARSNLKKLCPNCHWEFDNL